MCKCTKSLTLQRYIIPKLQKILKHAFNFFKGLLSASPEKGGCSQNQQLLVRISWHICDQHVIAASSWWSQQTRGDGNWLCGAAGPELSCNSFHSDIWMVCVRGFVFGGRSWRGTWYRSHSVREKGKCQCSGGLTWALLPVKTWKWINVMSKIL